MSSVPNQVRQLPQSRHEHRQSSIPRPTSSQACSQARSHVEAARSYTPASLTAPRRGSSNQQDSSPSHQPMHNGFSGARQQLKMHNKSTRALTSIDQVLSLSSNNNGTSTSLPLPAQYNLPNSETSKSLYQPKHIVTPHQQLMRPIHPPLPRSQTGGSLSCFSGAGDQGTPSPTKSEAGSAETATQPINLIDALRASRLDERELNELRQQSQERGWDSGQRHAAKPAGQGSGLPRSNTEESFIRLRPTASPRATAFPERTDSLPGFGRINPTFQEHVGQRLIQKDENRVLSAQKASDLADVDGLAQRFPASTSSALLDTSESDPDGEWDFNPKLVYFPLNSATWAGRFSSVCNRLKTSDAEIVDSNYDTRDPPHASGPPGVPLESFEEADRRRKRLALVELRYQCRTDAAVRSFEDFESRLREQYRRSGQPIPVSPPSSQIRQRRRSSGPGPGPNSGQRGIWQIGSANSSTASSSNASSSGPGSNVATRGSWQIGSASSSNARHNNNGDFSEAEKKNGAWRPSLPKSKTVTGNLARLRDSASNAPGTRSIRNNDDMGSSETSTRPGNSWQKPTVLEAQMHARKIREQRVMAAAAASRAQNAQRCLPVQASEPPASFKQGLKGMASEVTEISGVQAEDDGRRAGNRGRTGGHRRSSGAESVKKMFAGSMQSATRRLRRSFGGSHDESGAE